jgi:hypothetical protein
MAEQPLYEFTSHVGGKNAKVQIWPDRVEWAKPQSRSGVATVMTLGANYLTKRGVDTEMIPVKAISSVTTKKDGFINTLVSVIASGSTVDFRVSHKEAQAVKDVLTRLILA